MAMANSPDSHRENHLVWTQTTVDDRAVVYGHGGTDAGASTKPLVLFLPGWALGPVPYQRGLKRILQAGHEVLAPAMPGFGGSAPFNHRDLTIQDYADWLNRFLKVTAADRKVIVIGHSFGGAVAIKFAHAYPESVSYLVPVNAVGGTFWRIHHKRAELLSQRRIWDWAIGLTRELSAPHAWRVLPNIVKDELSNFRSSKALALLNLWATSSLARSADLVKELKEISENRVPVLAISSENDELVHKNTFVYLCAEANVEPRIVSGTHMWLMTDPDIFREQLCDVLGPIQGPQLSLVQEISVETTA